MRCSMIRCTTRWTGRNPPASTSSGKAWGTIPSNDTDAPRPNAAIPSTPRSRTRPSTEMSSSAPTSSPTPTSDARYPAPSSPSPSSSIATSTTTTSVAPDRADATVLYTSMGRAPRTERTRLGMRSAPVPTTSPVRGDSHRPTSARTAIVTNTAEESATPKIAPAIAGPSMVPTASIHPVTTNAAVASAVCSACTGMMAR